MIESVSITPGNEIQVTWKEPEGLVSGGTLFEIFHNVDENGTFEKYSDAQGNSRFATRKVLIPGSSLPTGLSAHIFKVLTVNAPTAGNANKVISAFSSAKKITLFASAEKGFLESIKAAMGGDAWNFNDHFDSFACDPWEGNIIENWCGVDVDSETGKVVVL